MKIVFLSSVLVFLIVIVLACQSGEIIANNGEKNGAVPIENNIRNRGQEEEVWIPDIIEKCVASVNVGEALEIATSINPFYLRADFDGNGLVDYAVLVQGQNTGKRGVVICKDSKETFVFGSVSKSKPPVSTFEDDNFITESWEIATKEETKSIADVPGGKKIATTAKGESIVFVFEGGNLYIFWDGRAFRIVEGV